MKSIHKQKLKFRQRLMGYLNVMGKNDQDQGSKMIMHCQQHERSHVSKVIPIFKSSSAKIGDVSKTAASDVDDDKINHQQKAKNDRIKCKKNTRSSLIKNKRLKIDDNTENVINISHKENKQDNQDEVEVQKLRNDVVSFLELDHFNNDDDDYQKAFDGPEESVSNKKIKTKMDLDDDSLFKERSQQLARKAHQTLQTSMFRYLNEYLYTHSSFESRRNFNHTKFQQYHEAYDRIIQQWPLKPVDFIIEQLKQRIKPKNLGKTVMADIGCGKRARIADAFPEATVYSFDLFSSEENQCSESDKKIIAADMCCLPLDNGQCDYLIYSLSLMATNLRDIFCEANRILKMSSNQIKCTSKKSYNKSPSSYVIIVEVASRFADYGQKVVNKSVDNKSTTKTPKTIEEHFERFGNDLRMHYGFRMIEHRLLPPNDYFVYFLLKKISNLEMDDSRSRLPLLQLKPCVYKLR